MHRVVPDRTQWTGNLTTAMGTNLLIPARLPRLMAKLGLGDWKSREPPLEM
jgi:hypothetical protein